MGIIIALFIVGLLLLLAEMLIIPGVGVAGVLGLLSLGGSCYYGFVHYGTVGGVIVTVICCLLVIGMLVYALRGKTWKKISLDTVIDHQPASASAIRVGMRGTTLTRLAPMGSARIGGVVCEVRCPDHLTDPGVEVEVIEIEDNKITVKPI